VFSDRVDEEPDSYLSNATLGELYLQRARSTSDLDDYDRAIRHLEVASSTSPAPVAIDLARAHLATHDFAAALDTVNATNEGPVAALTITFDALLGLGRLAEAGDVLASLELMHPTEPVILIRRAELSLLTGSGGVAVDAAEQAVRIALQVRLRATDLVFYQTAAARFHLLAGDPNRASDLSRSALDLDPTDTGAMIIHARAKTAQGDLGAARNWAERAVQASPEPASLSFLAHLLFALGEDAEAHRQLDTIEAIASLDQPALRRSTALALVEHSRDLPRALEMAAIELAERDDPYAHHLMATVLYQMGRTTDAEAHAQIAITVADPSVWYWAGLIAADSGDSDTAMDRLTAAFDFTPDFHPRWAPHASRLLEELAP
jgi:tetratricopeptide (TPR) repeat protein